MTLNLKFLSEKDDLGRQIFSWSMPAQYYTKQDRMVIYGTALTAGETRKGDKFNTEELRRGARSLIGGPIEVFEHSLETGKNMWLSWPDNAVLDAEEASGKIEYIAGISNPEIQQLIREGFLNQVSVNAICRHVPKEDPGQCYGMILNGFCLVPQTGVAASPGTYVKIWNCIGPSAHRLEGATPLETEVKTEMEIEGKHMSQNPKQEEAPAIKAETAPAQKAEQDAPVTGYGPVAGVPEPSIEDRVKTLEGKLEGLALSVNTQFTEVNAKLDTLILTQAPAPAVAVAAETIEKKAETAAEAKPEEPVKKWAGPEPEAAAAGAKAGIVVVAAFKPVEAAVKPVAVLTEQEILGVFADKRRFTPALQLNGILDLLEKKREAQAS